MGCFDSDALASPATGSYVVENSTQPGKGSIHRANAGIGPSLGVIDATGRDPGAALTTYEIFQRGRRLNPNGKCLGWRPIDKNGNAGPFLWHTYVETQGRMDNFASGMTARGLLAPLEDFPRGVLGIYMKNCPSWVIAEHAAYSRAATVAPLYDTLGPDSVAYVINQVGFNSIVISESELKSIIAAAKLCPTLQNVVVCHRHNDVVDGDALRNVVRNSSAAHLNLLTFEEVEAFGRSAPSSHIIPGSEDYATFCYTSGTTGNPKGALITHCNFVTDLAATIATGITGNQDDVELSYLPLPHIFERLIHLVMFGAGGCIGFYQGNPLKILEDIQEIQPTIFPSVPRLLNRVHDAINLGVQKKGGVAKFLFDRGVAAKTEGLRQGVQTHGLWDRLVFNKVKAQLGFSRIRLVVTGSAPISGKVLDFLRLLMACPVVEGYGQTECSAAATVTAINDFSTGHVGEPISCNEIRLEDVRDMGYLTTDKVHGEGAAAIPCDGRGEICFRGPNVFKQYYKMPEKTAEAVDRDGWLHSGDIGLWTAEGKLKIIDRKKNIFKLAQGEYIAAEKIENIYLQSQFVMQAFVYGDSLKSQLVAVIVPDPEFLVDFCADPKNGVSATTREEQCRNAKVVAAVLKSVQAAGVTNNLHGFEQAKALHLEPTPWEGGSDVLTPTFKLKRNIARDKYRPQIDRLYAALDGKQASKL
eukprot:TRINITY_DN12683_c0_g1_i1.p1 TRINITY_DN12683_c0_g1~~TRINITY_DN12683_c0_g1_i1.p1  ORF type:complete len:717 (+),score=182.88 TRINITY_DN12683_c0_g1_i1:57-2153(+)